MLCSFKRLVHPKTQSEAENGGYMVAIYKLHENVVDGHGDQIYDFKAVGYFLPLVDGIRFDMSGNWTKNSKHGLQFEVDGYEEIVAPTKDGIIAYLSSGLIKGVGKKTAERIYDMFGENTLEILDNRPQDLLRVNSISLKKLNRIVDSYVASRSAREVVSFLAPHGVSAKRAVKISKEFAPNTISIIKQHPYKLCEMHGIGFKTADGIAQSMGLSPLSPERIDAGLLQTLKDAEGKGNLCIPIPAFMQYALKLLNTSELSMEMLAERALCLDKSGKIVRYNNQVYRAVMANTEQAVANRIQEVMTFGSIKYKCDLNTEINRIQKKMGIVLAPEQRAAIKTGLTSRLCVITGGPGTGKSLILRFLLEIFSTEHNNSKTVCCAPTGRAARRMEECTSYKASTIHKALNLMGSDEDEEEDIKKLDADLVLVDEVSMLDIFISKHLFTSLPHGCQVVFIGDAEQLPSVGPGAVLSEMIGCGVIPVAKLDKVYRQNAGSRIAVNAGLIRHGMMNLEYGSDFQFYESPGFAQSANFIENLYLSEIARWGVDNVALLTPFRRKTETGVDALNARLRDLVNPPDKSKQEVCFGKKLFRLGDKVMQTKNQDYINNGDIGYINKIAKQFDETTLHVDFGDGRLAKYDYSELDVLELAYAQTVHKSQGSEYASVIINLQAAHSIMLKRPLIYTAITRAKQTVAIVGERKALCTAIRTVDAEKRGTMLAARILANIKSVA